MFIIVKKVENLSEEERREEEKISICRDSLFDSQVGEKWSKKEKYFKNFQISFQQFFGAKFLKLGTTFSQNYAYSF